MTKSFSISETSATVFLEDSTVKPAEEDFAYNNLNNALAEIKKAPGVTGYILKSPKSATIDLSDPNKLVEYSLLASKIMDSSNAAQKLFDIGKIETITIEGNSTKALFIIKDENRVSIFMDKSVDCAEVLKKIKNKLAAPKLVP
jgi:predicted regulator of Ras-like GTPase activity (Roadblock/LC7/MglB family)